MRGGEQLPTKCERLDDYMRVQLTTAIGWTSRHKAFGWSVSGMTELVALPDAKSESSVLFARPEEDIDGICLFYGEAWLGSATFDGDAKAKLSAFLTNAPQWPDALTLAVQAHLPVLDSGVAAAIGARMRGDGGGGRGSLPDRSGRRTRACSWMPAGTMGTQGETRRHDP